jgi:hypothetical protein
MRSLPMLGPRAQWQRYASVLYLTTGIHSLFDNKHSSSQAFLRWVGAKQHKSSQRQ